MTDRISVGVVGTGKMGILHGGILHSLDQVEPRAIVEKEKQLHTFIKTVLPNMTVYADSQDMLHNENLDLVYIVTPTPFHVEIAEACVDRGINFFVEKPLGMSASQCRPLIDKVKRNPVINMVGYCNHFVDTFKKAKEIIDSNSLGRLIHLSSHIYVSQVLIKSKKGKGAENVRGEGVLNHLATHLIDVLLWFFGDISEVNGNVRSHYSQNVDDFAHAYLVFKSGLEGYIDTSWSLRNYRLPEIKIEVEGEEGKLIATSDYVKLYFTKTSQWQTYYTQDLYDGVEIDVGGPEYTREDTHMVQSVLNKQNTGIDVMYALKVQKVTDAIYESSLQRSPFTLGPEEN